LALGSWAKQSEMASKFQALWIKARVDHKNCDRSDGSINGP
jgi:hypothetical protein